MKMLQLPPRPLVVNEARRMIAGGHYVAATLSHDTELRGFHLQPEIFAACAPWATDDDFLAATANSLYCYSATHLGTIGGKHATRK